jgi:hypothetical protein
MKKLIVFSQFIILISCFSSNSHAQDDEGINNLYSFRKNVEPRWASFENPTAGKGTGGKLNKGAKGRPYEKIEPGETKTLLDVKGSGVINRIWITLSERDPVSLRALRLEMYWDGSDKPAVSVPFGDFFGDILGRSVPFENELFSDPEGRSFNCVIPMPFRTAAKVTVTNEEDKQIRLFFYDINFSLQDHDDNMLYFHAYWHRETDAQLGLDFEILPRVPGRGRFLGTHVGVITDSVYLGMWWGEGEVKVYLDGDKDFPTLVGTGAEDYPGSAWGLGTYANRYQGCLMAEDNKYSFYRYHVPDPIFFSRDCRVTIQRMGGGMKSKVIEAHKGGARLEPVTLGYYHEDGTIADMLLLQDMDPVPDIEDASLPSGWMNFYRIDDYSAVAFFYLDSPVNGLPQLQGKNKRVENLK